MLSVIYSKNSHNQCSICFHTTLGCDHDANNQQHLYHPAALHHAPSSTTSSDARAAFSPLTICDDLLVICTVWSTRSDLTADISD